MKWISLYCDILEIFVKYPKISQKNTPQPTHIVVSIGGLGLNLLQLLFRGNTRLPRGGVIAMFLIASEGYMK